MRIISWNVNGIRASVKKGLIDQINNNQADIWCFQETKAQDDQVMEALSDLSSEYHIQSTSAIKKGYSGVAILAKKSTFGEAAPSWSSGLSIDEHDQEGRLLRVDAGDFHLVNVYVPNSSSGMKRLPYRKTWDIAFANYLKTLREEKPVIVTGDFNVAHQPIDLARPKENYNKTSGYTQDEIDGMDLLLDQGFFDAFRTMHPEKAQYTFWNMRFKARERNVGWRLDYFLVDKTLQESTTSSAVMDDIHGSDHCPIDLELNLG